jgi:hypothetical protein
MFYDLTDVVCEVCKQPHPGVFMLNGVQTLLIEPDIPEKDPFAVLEIFHTHDQKRLKALVIINMAKDSTTTIGRGNKNDIMFKDKSVSPHHAELVIKKCKIFIVDKNSKHGTYKALTESSKLDSFTDRIYSIGKWLAEFHPYKDSYCGCFEDINESHRVANNPFFEYPQLLESNNRQSINIMKKIDNNIIQLEDNFEKNSNQRPSVNQKDNQTQKNSEIKRNSNISKNTKDDGNDDKALNSNSSNGLDALEDEHDDQFIGSPEIQPIDSSLFDIEKNDKSTKNNSTQPRQIQQPPNEKKSGLNQSGTGTQRRSAMFKQMINENQSRKSIVDKQSEFGEPLPENSEDDSESEPDEADNNPENENQTSKTQRASNSFRF